MHIDNMNVEERMRHYNVPGMCISLINDGVYKNECYGVLEKGSNKNVKQNTIFNACSISKLATSMLVLVLVERGILNLDEDVNKSLKSWKLPVTEYIKEKTVTLRTLLCHQGGIKDPDGSFEILKSTDKAPKMMDLLNGRSFYCNELIQPSYVPGTEFHYSDAGFCIIQQIIEDATKKSFKDNMNEHIFKPLQMKNSFLIDQSISHEKDSFACGHNKKGEVVYGKDPIYPYLGASGLWSTPTDIAFLVSEIMDALHDNSKLHISRENIEDMIQPQGCAAWTGLGLFLDDSNEGIEISSLGWGVGFQCMMVAYPIVKKALIVMTNTDLGVHQMEGIIGEVYRGLEL